MKGVGGDPGGTSVAAGAPGRGAVRPRAGARRRQDSHVRRADVGRCRSGGRAGSIATRRQFGARESDLSWIGTSRCRQARAVHRRPQSEFGEREFREMGVRPLQAARDGRRPRRRDARREQAVAHGGLRSKPSSNRGGTSRARSGRSSRASRRPRERSRRKPRWTPPFGAGVGVRREATTESSRSSRRLLEKQRRSETPRAASSARRKRRLGPRALDSAISLIRGKTSTA